MGGTSWGQVTSLISSDIKRFEVGVGELHSLWAGPILIVTVGAVLWTMYDAVAVAGLFALLLIIPAISKAIMYYPWLF